MAYSRASRDYDFVPSMGANLVIAQYNAAGVAYNPIILDIETGFLREMFINALTPHSGSNGAILRTRVGSDWSCALVLNFPATVEIEPAQPVAVATSFIQSIAGSSRSVAVRWNIGDPLFWQDRGLPVRNMRARKALLSTCETRLDSTGLAVVGLNVALEGNSLLWTYEDDTPIHPGVWW